MYHEPVLVDEVIKLLIGNRDGIYVDGTVGGGGHSEALLEHTTPKACLIGLDMDDEALQAAKLRLRNHDRKVHLEQANFRDVGRILDEREIKHIDGFLLDLGVSSHQIDSAERGFSFATDGPLDMRMRKDSDMTAREIVNSCSEQELTRLIKAYGEEHRARAIARTIIKERKRNPIESTRELREIISRVLPEKFRIKSLARVFQALRIAVNSELDNLSKALETILPYLKQGGRIVIISYHSLEDRMVKQFFRHEALSCVCPPEAPICTCDKQARLQVLTKRPVQPSETEMAMNPRSRSARLRAAERLP